MKSRVRLPGTHLRLFKVIFSLNLILSLVWSEGKEKHLGLPAYQELYVHNFEAYQIANPTRSEEIRALQTL